MVSKIRLIVSLALAPWALCAQTAEDHFHRGAQFYVFGEKSNAVVEVATGLQKFPDDEPLRALADILAKQEEQQQNQQPNQQKKPEDQEKQQEDQPQGKQDQQEPQDKKDPEQQQAKSSGEQKANEREKGEPSQPLPAHAMTPQEAQQLLDAQKGEEQFLQFKPVTEKPERRQRPIKDW